MLKKTKKSAHYHSSYVALISATMQNNTPRDIQSQIYLFEREPKHSSFERVEGRDLDSFFNRINRKYTEIIRKGRDEKSADNATDRKELIRLSQDVREKVLNDILVRRTRQDIKKYYSRDSNFAHVHGPSNLYYEIDGRAGKLFDETVEVLLASVAKHLFYKESLSKQEYKDLDDKQIGYFRYKAIMFLKNSDQKQHAKAKIAPKQISQNLAKMMATSLVKRLESSFDAFKKSLENFKQKNTKHD